MHLVRFAEESTVKLAALWYHQRCDLTGKLEKDWWQMILKRWISCDAVYESYKASQSTHSIRAVTFRMYVCVCVCEPSLVRTRASNHLWDSDCVMKLTTISIIHHFAGHINSFGQFERKKNMKRVQCNTGIIIIIKPVTQSFAWISSIDVIVSTIRYRYEEMTQKRPHRNWFEIRKKEKNWMCVKKEIVLICCNAAVERHVREFS